MKKKRILMCCSTLNVNGGMVSVVKNYLSFEKMQDYEYVYIPTHVEKNKLMVALYFLYSYTKILFTCFFGNIEIAHLHTAERGSFFRKAILLKTLKLFKIKVILHHHAAEFESFYGSLPLIVKKFVVNVIEDADLNIVLSKRLVKDLLDKAPNANVKYLYNAVKTYVSNPYNKEAKNCVFLGRLGKRKGTYDLITAIELCINDIPNDVTFLLCGDGDIEKIKTLIRDKKLEERVKVLGWISGAEKERIIRDSMINVLPSYNEGLPMTILETMAAGIPNISTNIASIPEVIEDGINGFLICPGDVEGIANVLRRLINDKRLRDDFSEKSYDLITNGFSLTKHMEEVFNIYKELTE